MIKVRRAERADAEALVRLRALMLEAMGMDTDAADKPWREAALRFFTEGLSSPKTFAAFVVDDPEVGVVACAVGHCNVQAPSPKDPTTTRGYLYNVSTEPAFRRRGLARDCVTTLLDWFRDETEVGQVELYATEQGGNLYRKLGFADTSHPAQRLAIVR